MRQLKLEINRGRWGGRRSGSGRKRIHSSGVAHRKRTKVTIRNPTHINIRYSLSIKNKEFLVILKRAILNCRKKGLRILHYSVQSNHIHFIIEADGHNSFISGMRSLTTTLSMGIGKGRIQSGRYHLHVLKCPREAKNAFKYVVFNEAKHTGQRQINSYSSVGKYLKLKFNYCVTELDEPKSWLSSQSS